MGDAGLVELIAPEGDLTARFAVGAGMVGCSLREGGEELLGIGEGLAAYLHHGAVLGIPLLYPWANRLGGWDYEACGMRVELDDLGLPTGRATELAAEAFAFGDRTYDDLFAVAPGSQSSVAAGGRRATVELTSSYRYAQCSRRPISLSSASSR